MTQSDETVLEILATLAPCAAPPGVIHHNVVTLTPLSLVKETVNNSLRRLTSAGLVESVPETAGYHRLTDAGDKYLAGETTPPSLD